jgi:hypothetical protein
MVKFLSVTCLKVENLFLNGKIEQWNSNFYISNFCISFASYSKSKILKLQILSNEQSLDGNLLPKWKKSVYSSNNGITIYYRFVPLNRYRSTPTPHPWCQLHSGAAGLVVGPSKLSTEHHQTYVDHYRDKVKWTGLWTSCPIKDYELLDLHRKLAQKPDLWTKLVKVAPLQEKPNCMTIIILTHMQINIHTCMYAYTNIHINVLWYM